MYRISSRNGREGRKVLQRDGCKLLSAASAQPSDDNCSMRSVRTSRPLRPSREGKAHLPPSAVKTIRPRNLAVPGPNLGVGVRHALFPDGTQLGASLSRAVCFPTPLSAACGCFGLMAGPFQPFPVGICRVRSCRPVRSLPAGSGSPDVVRTRLQFLISRVGTFATGTAPACDRTLAPRYGSDLLTLRLRSFLQ